MLEHYFHQSYQFRAKRRNIHSLRISTSKTLSHQPQNFLCMSNGNAIEIYKITSQTVDFFMRKEFFCNIRKLQVIPSLHHDSDYIFIIDDLGRYSFWKPGEGQIQTCNVIQVQKTSKRFYREELSPEEEEQFSGSAFRFDVKDTVGHLFFTVQNKLTVLSISIKSREGLKIQNSRTYEIPYTRFRYVNMLNLQGVKESQVYIGIIQELEEKTILKIHALNILRSSTLIDEESLSYKIQKTNLLSFQSGQDDQIIVLTYDEISLYKYKQANYFCNYRTRGNYGSACYIPSNSSDNLKDATYVHLGLDMTVFTKSKLHSYGPLKIDEKSLLENRGILQSKFLGYSSTQEVILAFITNFNEVYFVLLAENKWKLIRQIPSLSSIFSLNQLNRSQNDHSLIVVHAAEQNTSKITHVEITSPTIMDQEQFITDKLIESIDLVEDGQSLIISSEGQSSLLSWEENSKRWVEHFGFNNLKEQILACTGIHVVMTSGIYKYEVSESEELTMTQILKQENILSAVTNKQYIGYYTSEGNFKFYEIESNSVARVRKNCIEEYIWHMMSGKNILVSAAYNEPGQLRILPVHKVATKIQLQTKQIVASISSICYSNDKKDKMVDENSEQEFMTDIIVGFHNGDVKVFSLDLQKTVAKFNVGSEMVSITSYRNSHTIVYTASKQYILSRMTLGSTQEKKKMLNGTNCQSQECEYRMSQVEFSDYGKSISKLLYLPKFDKFITLLSKESSLPQNTLLQLRSLKLNKKLSDNQLMLQLKSAISTKTIFKTQHGEGIPFVQVFDDDYIFVVLPQSIFKYCIRTKELVKKQLHLLKEIVGVEKIQAGVIVTGVDFMESGSVVLFDFNDLNIKSTHNLGRSRPSCIKAFKNSKYSNRFLIHHDTYLTLFETEPTNLISSLKTINTKTVSSSMDLNEKYNKIMLTDQYRYLSVWDYDLQVVSQDFVPVSKYFGSYAINDCCWLDGAVLTGDRGGNISILEFNLGNKHDLHKINMTKVGQIYVGEEVFTLRKTEPDQQRNESKEMEFSEDKSQVNSSVVYYGTSSGSIGMIKTISENDFKLLKQIELDAIKCIDLKEHFSYEQWRKRIPQQDKVIDSQLVRYYLEEMKSKVKLSQEDFYNEVNAVYKRVIGETKGQRKN